MEGPGAVDIPGDAAPANKPLLDALMSPTTDVEDDARPGDPDQELGRFVDGSEDTPAESADSTLQAKDAEPASVEGPSPHPADEPAVESPEFAEAPAPAAPEQGLFTQESRKKISFNDAITVEEEEIELEDDHLPDHGQRSKDDDAALFSYDIEPDDSAEALIESLVREVSRSSTRSIRTQDFCAKSATIEREGKSIRAASRRFIEPIDIMEREGQSLSSSSVLFKDSRDILETPGSNDFVTTEVQVQETSIDSVDHERDTAAPPTFMQREDKSMRGPSRRFTTHIPIASMSVDEVEVTETEIKTSPNASNFAYENNFSFDIEPDSAAEAQIDALLGGVIDTNTGRSVIIGREKKHPDSSPQQLEKEGMTQRATSVLVRDRSRQPSWRKDHPPAPAEETAERSIFGSMDVYECESGEVEIVPSDTQHHGEGISSEELDQEMTIEQLEAMRVAQGRSKSVSFGMSSFRQYSAPKGQQNNPCAPVEHEDEDDGMIIVPVRTKTKSRAAISEANRKCADWAADSDGGFAPSNKVQFETTKNDSAPPAKARRRRDPTPYVSRGAVLDETSDEEDGDRNEEDAPSKSCNVSFAEQETTPRGSRKTTRRIARRDPTPFVSRSFTTIDDDSQDDDEEHTPRSRESRSQGPMISFKPEKPQQTKQSKGTRKVSKRSPTPFVSRAFAGLDDDVSESEQEATKGKPAVAFAAAGETAPPKTRQVRKRDPTPWAPRSFSALSDESDEEIPEPSPKRPDPSAAASDRKKGGSKQCRAVRKRDPTPWAPRSFANNEESSDDQDTEEPETARPVLRKNTIPNNDCSHNAEDIEESDSKSVIVIAPRSRPKATAGRKAAVQKIRKRDPTPYCARGPVVSSEEEEEEEEEQLACAIRFVEGTNMKPRPPVRRRRDSTPHLKRFINLDDYSDYSDEGRFEKEYGSEASPLNSRRVTFGAEDVKPQKQTRKKKGGGGPSVVCFDAETDDHTPVAAPSRSCSMKSTESEEIPKSVSFGADATFMIEPRERKGQGFIRGESSSSSSLSPSSSVTSTATTSDERTIRFTGEAGQNESSASKTPNRRPARPKRDATPFVPRSFAHADDSDASDDSSGVNSSFDSESGRTVRRSRSRQIEVVDRDDRED